MRWQSMSPNCHFRIRRLKIFAALLTPLIAAVFSSVASAADGQGRLVWFGTYTGGRSQSEGLYVSRFDDDTGRLSTVRLAAPAKNPSFLALHPALPVLYAVSETAGSDGRPQGAVVSFRIDPSTGILERQSEQPSGGSGPCHLSVDRSGRVLLAANYGGGSVICLGLEADGSLRPVVPGGFLQHEGSSLNPKRQQGPHGHSIDASPDGRFAISCDLGIDKVLVHGLDTAAATLAPHSAASMAPAAGPRHFALHPNGRFGYVVNELDLTVTACGFDPAAGVLTPLQSLSTLPDGVSDREGFSTAEIAVHPNGQTVYASNRGHDSIASFAIDAPTGRLSFLGCEPIRGKTPRHFAIDPSGRHLLAAGQHSDTVAVFAIDPNSGRMRFTGQSIDVPSPVCVLFHPSR
jgi:6-phosphogluconolactonase